MYNFLCLLLFIPATLLAQQPVTPIVSADYLSLKHPYAYPAPVKTIRIHNGTLTIIPEKETVLTLGGNYTISSATRMVNTTPSLESPPTISAPYNNIFTPGHMLSHSLSLQANIKRDQRTPLWSFSLKATTNNENTVLPDNANSAHSLSMSAERYINKISIAGGYSYFFSRFSNDNSYGFLNRVYENALLTPINEADNPWFLLKDNGHFDKHSQQTANLSVQKKQGTLTFGVLSALDAVDGNSNQSLKPGTAFFPAGLPYARQQNDRHYSANAYAAYIINYNNYHYVSAARLNYINNKEEVNISYPDANAIYHYNRSSNDASFTFNTTYTKRNIDAGLNAGNKFYGSNTSPKNKFFMPDISGFIRFQNIIDYSLDARLAATYNSFCSEPSLSNTLSSYMLTRLAPRQAFTFMPTTEVQSFNTIAAMQHREFTSKVQLDLLHSVTVNADMSIRDTKGNVFPVYENNSLVLKNLADTRYKGFELQLVLYRIPAPAKYFSMTNSISFYTFTNIVTRIRQGQDGIPIAGFTTVHKTLIKGQPLGVITTNTNQLSVIGNPTPDFTLKFSHLVNWRNFTVNIDWEYRKGGDVWNGTQAVLDYYSQSQRYGYTGIAETYMEKGDNIRIHLLSIAYNIKIKKYLQRIRLTAYAENLMLWSAYKGADPNQLLYDQPGSGGLDFFNLPSTRTFGANISIQF